MTHGVMTVEGRARTWYWPLVEEVLSNHTLLPCRQGVALESPHSLVAVVGPADDLFTALASVDLPRRGDPDQRMTFSILYALRRLLGYHDTVLFDKYPVLARYTPCQTTPYHARSIAYTRFTVPPEDRQAPWVRAGTVEGQDTLLIDQVQRVVCLLTSNQGQGSRRALIDFGEGFKARCVMSWLFLVRNGQLRIYQHMRSNDLVVGMPNNLVDARLAQVVMAAMTGCQIGEVHHQASIIQIYQQDIAGVDCVTELGKLRQLEEQEATTIARLRQLPILTALDTILRSDWTRPTEDATDGLARYQRIMAALEDLFWTHNPQCSPAHRACVDHLIGRYGPTDRTHELVG